MSSGNAELICVSTTHHLKIENSAHKPLLRCKIWRNEEAPQDNSGWFEDAEDELEGEEESHSKALVYKTSHRRDQEQARCALGGLVRAAASSPD